MVTGLHFMTNKKTKETINAMHKLSIQVGLNGLSFSTQNTLSNTIERVSHHPFEDVTNPNQLLEEVKEIFDSEEQLLDFREVVVYHVNELSAFVPKAFFNKNKLSSYLKFNSKILQNDFIDYDMIANNEMVNVYVPYVNINNYFIDRFGEFEYRHFASVLVEKLLNQVAYAKDARMFVHVQKGQFEVVVIKQKKLLLYNSFFHQTKEDFIYYILFVAEQLQMNPEEFQLHLLGDISAESKYYQLAYTYIRNISFFDSSSTPELAETVLMSEAAHDNFVLFG